MKQKEKKKPDLRKIPQLFRAVEKGTYNPRSYYGFFISDDYYNFVSYSSHDKEGSHFKERVLEKREFSFSKISADEIELNCKIAIHNMKKEMTDKLLDYEAAQHNANFAEKKLNEMLGKL